MRHETRALRRHGSWKGFRFFLGLALVFFCVQDAWADTWPIAAENRDAWDDTGSGNLDLADFGDAFWDDSAGYQWAATIPPGAQITSAKIRVYSNAHTGNTGAYTARIHVEDVDNAVAFDGTPNNIRGRTFWSTTVDWNIPGGGLTIGSYNDSPDITNLIQHIVDRPGWSSGNYIDIAIWGQTSVSGARENLADWPSNPAELVVTFTPQADLSLTKEVNNHTPDVGSNVTFTLTLSNGGSEQATNVTVTDVVPSGLDYVASSISGGDARDDSDPVGGGLTWTVNALNSGASATLTFQTTVTGVGGTPVTNGAEVTASDLLDRDSTPGNGVTTEDDYGSVTFIPLEGAGSCPAPSLIFSDGFESGNLSAWDGTVTSTAGDSVVVSTNQANTGIRSAKVETDNLDQHIAFVHKSFAGETTASVRIRFYLDPSFSTPNFVELIYFHENSSNFILATQINDDMTLSVWNEVGSQEYLTTETVSTGVWHTLEMTAVINGANGEARMWLDGKLLVNQTGINLGTNPITYFRAGHLFSNDPNPASIHYIDDVILCAEQMTAVIMPPVYRSVGTNAGNLNTFPRAVEISGTTATFDGPMPDNVGVGDALTYNSGGNQLAFIHRRTSPNVFTVKDKAGGTPTAALTGTAVGVYRAYNSLSNWESQVENPSINEPTEDDVNPPTDLVSTSTTMMVACYGDGVDTTAVTINGWNTGVDNYIRIFTPTSTREVGTSQRHGGTWDTTKYHLDVAGGAVLVNDNYVRIDGLQLRLTADVAGLAIVGFTAATGAASYEVSNSIVRGNGAGTADVRLGINLWSSSSGVVKIWNNIVYDLLGATTVSCIAPDDVGFTFYIYNNTVVDCKEGISNFAGTVIAKNNLVYNNVDNYSGTFNGASTNNLSGPGTDAQMPVTNARDGVTVTFVNAAGDDFHLASGDTGAQDFGADLSGDADLAFAYDIDLGGRQTPWDIGADDVLATTAVELVSFTAAALDAAVALRWETGSELNNLGFHLYRAESAGGPYERITSTAIPGLGSSPEGASYSYQDSGLTNGATYYYKLEDIETTGKTELHGPVSAMPRAGATVDDADDEGGTPSALITYGDPSASFLRVLKRGRSQVVLELTTGGFYAEPQEDGTVQLTIPDFGELSEAGSPSLPVRRTWVEAIAGRKVELVSVEAHGLEAFTSLHPSGTALVELVATREGTVRAARRQLRASFQTGELYPSEAARVVSVGFQGEVKKALVELAPLRWDEATAQLLLAKRLVVRLSFRGREPGERSTSGSRGRRYRKRQSHDERRVVARLATTGRGLYGVRYEDVFNRSRGVRASELRVSRQGETVAFHLEPDADRFEPGSFLYFVSVGASANPYGREAVYELEASQSGERMAELSSAPSGSGNVTPFYWKHLEQEENRYYQPALVEAPDRWLWDLLFAPVVKSYRFEVSALASTTESSRLSVWLQGVSDFRANPDHHVRVSVNGSFLEDVSWDGKQARRIDVELPPGVVFDGENFLELENVGDTEAAYSMVMLDRFTVSYPRWTVAENAKLEGSWSHSGVAELRGLGSGAHVLDVTDEKPLWLTGSELGADGTLRFRAESSRSYLAVGPDAVLHPEVRPVWASGLKSTRNRADYLMLGPRVFLDVAKPLLELRQSQGLAVKAVAIEDVFADFGFGETTPQAVRDFLSYAYHNWEAPSPRYVVLLGDATYDYKDYLGTGVSNQVPPMMVKTSYLWTASDPTYASVNGEDLLPDLAIGRLPAATADEARTMVEKIVAYETGDVSLDGPAVLIADDADRAGDFRADAEELASGVLAGRDLRKIYLSELGTVGARDAILQSFDEGASLMSYLGHGGIHLWADENLLNIWQVGSLSTQSQQPLLLTMNCLNGYYHFPFFNSLSEELLKADGKGAVATFSPSGLSLNAPAHVYHQALLQELLNGSHERLGDAVMAAQEAYAATGAFPELLSIYHLLGDPAMRLK